MRPADDHHPMSATGGPPRPGGGTYPVRPVVSAPRPSRLPAERPKPPPRPLPSYTADRKSPRGLLAVILIGIGLVTMVLVIFSVSGYLPDAGGTAESQAEPAPAAAPDN